MIQKHMTAPSNLLNTGTPNSGPMIVDSIRKLGYRPDDIKIIINGHGHSDHAGAFAYLKKLTGAQIAVMREDVSMIEDGGRSDFHYGHDWEIMGQPPVKVDRVLRDGDTVRLGEVVLTATPSYPGITEDFRRTLHTLEMLKPDIWAGHHTEYFDLKGKRRAFEDEVDLELGIAPSRKTE